MDDQILSSFEKLGSPDSEIVFEGVKEVNGLIRQVCNLELPASGDTTRRKAFTSQLNTQPIREFLKLQDSFTFNVVSRLAMALHKLHNDQLALALSTIEGLCLLHHPSREVFQASSMMKLLLQELSPEKPIKVQVAAINALVSVMVRNVENIRKFEEMEGVRAICNLFKSKDTPKDVKVEILEFLFFYLIPETKHKNLKPERKTTEEKSMILGKYLSNVTGLVRELNTSTPFCDMDLEW